MTGTPQNLHSIAPAWYKMPTSVLWCKLALRLRLLHQARACSLRGIELSVEMSIRDIKTELTNRGEF